MNDMALYPKRCSRNLHRIVDATGASVETAYGMMLMTAMLMDLHPEDEEVADMILEDCGISSASA